MSLQLGTLVGELALDNSGLRTGMADALADFGGFGGKLGVLATGIGGAAAAALTAGFMAADLEAGTDRVAASLDLLPDEAARVAAVTGDVFASGVGEGMDQVNTAVENLIAQMGGLGDVTNEELEDATGAALNLATVMGTDVTDVVQVAGQAVREGMAGDFEEAFDLIAAASAKTMPNLRDDLLDAADEYQPFFDTLGMGGEQAFGLLAKASEKGMYGIDKLGDSLKEFTLRSTDMSDSTNAAYAAIGVNGDKMADDLLAGGQRANTAFDTIITGLQGIKDPSDRAQAAIALFGTPLEDLSVSEIPTFLDSLTKSGSALDNVAGAADRTGATLNDNATSNLTTFGRSMQTWFVDTIGGKVLPILTEVVTSLNANFGPTVMAVSGWIAGTAVPAFQAVAHWIGENRTPILAVAAAITAFLLPSMTVAAATSVTSAATTIGSWFATKAAGISSAASQAASHWVTIGGWIKSGAVAVAQGAVVAGAWIAQKAQALGSAAAQAPAFIALMGQYVAMGASAVASTAVVIGAWIAQKAAALVNVAITVASIVGGWIAMAASSIAGAVVMAAAWFIALGPVGWVIAAIVALVVLIVVFWDEIKEATVAIFTAIWEWLKGLWDSVIDIFHTVIDWIAENWPLLLAIITGPFGLAIYFILKFKDDIIAGIKTAVDWVITKFGELIGFVTSLPGKIASAAKGLWDGIVSAFKSAINVLIGLWNNFSITLGGGSVLGMDIPSITLNTPDIPYLATGGNITGAGLAVVGERGPELLHLPRGAAVEPLSGGGGGRLTEDRLARLERIVSSGRGGIIWVENQHITPVSDRPTPSQWADDMRYGAMT